MYVLARKKDNEHIRRFYRRRISGKGGRHIDLEPGFALGEGRRLPALRSRFRSNEPVGVPLLDELVPAGELFVDSLD